MSPGALSDNHDVFVLFFQQLIIIAGVTDVWSAIRNTTVSRIISFMEYFSLEQIEDVFVAFAKVNCQIFSDFNSTKISSQFYISLPLNTIMLQSCTSFD